MCFKHTIKGESAHRCWRYMAPNLFNVICSKNIVKVMYSGDPNTKHSNNGTIQTVHTCTVNYLSVHYSNGCFYLNGSSNTCHLTSRQIPLHYLNRNLTHLIPERSAIRLFSTILKPDLSRIWIPTVIVLEKIETVETFQIADKYLSIIQIVEKYMSIIQIADKYMSFIQIVFDYQIRV